MSVGWQDIQARFKELMTACDSSAPLTAAWNAYRDAVLATRDNPPYHLVAPIRLAEEAAARRGRDKVRILDHGCGGGGTLLYLLILGYKGIHGVDIGGDCANLNRLLRDECGIEEERFVLYDGRSLPFDDETFDLLFSEEVVEHVPEAMIGSYYSEGARVLRRDGIAYFTVPHRLGPYDSHTRTWFIHYLPRRIALALHGWKSDSRRLFVENHLFLRWPGFHQAMVRKQYGASEDITRGRLMTLVNLDYYDGPRRLRLWLGRVSRIPGIGGLAQRVIGALLLRQTLSRKEPGRLPVIYG